MLTPAIVAFLWIGLIIVLVLIVVDLIATAVAIKVLRHVEIMEESHTAPKTTLDKPLP